MKKSFKYIDLFAGAGGLSEGFISEEFSPIAHVEKDAHACKTILTRVGYHHLKENKRLEEYFSYLKGEITYSDFIQKIPEELIRSVINKEISEESFEEITTQINVDKVDVIIGGPPCQAYSVVGRARVREEDKRVADPRRFLYKQYIKFILKYQPKIFVFENVPGILNTKDKDGIKFIEKIKAEFEEVGYTIDFQILDSSLFGVLQKRLRVIIIGWKTELPLNYPSFENESIDNSNWLVKRDILDDLPQLQANQNWTSFEYAGTPSDYLIDSSLRSNFDVLTQHNARFTNENDKEIYRRTIAKWYDEGKRLHYTELPEELKTQKNQSSFLNRFSVVEGNMPYAHTMVAHIAIDGHYYIHPDPCQSRSITVREAARIQSFPDNYYFEGSRSSAFTQIGNAVPPLMAKVIAKKIKEMLWKIN
ncbi:DNA cytosine methyltransferase [Flectobacillus major]|uniref:DNA cytosine methyltransferase n=1 Tax=Flectobacillus major TaxID=103 RepID=UPI00040C78DF|nr:DNA cytosine methyltransferase [Flectobacillus major]